MAFGETVPQSAIYLAKIEPTNLAIQMTANSLDPLFLTPDRKWVSLSKKMQSRENNSFGELLVAIIFRWCDII